MSGEANLPSRNFHCRFGNFSRGIFGEVFYFFAHGRVANEDDSMAAEWAGDLSGDHHAFLYFENSAAWDEEGGGFYRE